MRTARVIIYAAAVVLLLFGFIWLIGAIFALIRLLVGLIMLGTAAALVYLATFWITEPTPLTDYESQVSSLARKLHGQLTVARVVADLDIPTDIAKRVLNNMARKGVCHPDLQRFGDDYADTFTFPEFTKKTP